MRYMVTLFEVLLLALIAVGAMHLLGTEGIVAVLLVATLCAVFIHAATRKEAPWWARRQETPRAESTALAPPVYVDNRQFHYHAGGSGQTGGGRPASYAPPERQLPDGAVRWVSEIRYTASGSPYLFQGYETAVLPARRIEGG